MKFCFNFGLRRTNVCILHNCYPNYPIHRPTLSPTKTGTDRLPYFLFLQLIVNLSTPTVFYLLIVNLIDLITVPFSIFMRLLSVFVQLVLICLCVYSQQILKQSVEKAPLDGEFWSVSLVLLLKLTRCSTCYRMNFIMNSISLNEYYKHYNLDLPQITDAVLKLFKRHSLLVVWRRREEAALVQEWSCTGQ